MIEGFVYLNKIVATALFGVIYELWVLIIHDQTKGI